MSNFRLPLPEDGQFVTVTLPESRKVNPTRNRFISNPSGQFRHDEIFRRLETWRAARAFDVLEDLSLVVADDHAIRIAAQNILRTDGHFDAATRRINHVRRHGIAGCVSTQTFHDLQSPGDAAAQMRGARNG